MLRSPNWNSFHKNNSSHTACPIDKLHGCNFGESPECPIFRTWPGRESDWVTDDVAPETSSSPIGTDRPPKDWGQVMAWSADLLGRSSGAGVSEWNARIATAGVGTETELRDWLKDNGVTGYAQMLLVMETFGYPDFLTPTSSPILPHRDRRGADRGGSTTTARICFPSPSV